MLRCLTFRIIMFMPRYAWAAVLVLVWAAPTSVRTEKLSAFQRGQNREFDLSNDNFNFNLRPGILSGHAIRSSEVGLSTPQSFLTPATPLLVLDAPPAPIPTFPPATSSEEFTFPIRRPTVIPHRPLPIIPQGPVAGFPQGPVPAINALYDVPNAETSPQSTRGSCRPQTVVVTSRNVVVSTRVSVSQVVVPTTVVQRVTSTAYQVQTELQTSYVTVQGPTQVVTSRVVEARYVTQTTTVTSPVLQTVTSITTKYQQQYVTNTQTQYVPNTACPSTPMMGYSYSKPTADSALNADSGQYDDAVVRPLPGGYYGSAISTTGYQGPFYGPFYTMPIGYQSRKKGVFSKW
ncbi:mucin-2-like isoform X2 [Homarus americanus]|uniref:mucin-2-like isoform X2 n=1 Tax=Homarus americanus TaxID=6706 RepID=UPI001C4773AD|nr:mucin-2-like isoform X2 [Homarus americanus]